MMQERQLTWRCTTADTWIGWKALRIWNNCSNIMYTVDSCDSVWNATYMAHYICHKMSICINIISVISYSCSSESMRLSSKLDILAACDWWQLECYCVLRTYLQCESKKSPPRVFWKFFPNGWEFLVNLKKIRYHVYTRLQIFIQLSPTLILSATT